MKYTPSSPSRVIKLPGFKGRLPERNLYVYLPPGYDDQPDVRYPVIYMHDGQNCFQGYVGDSFAGSWRADETADCLIKEGTMRPCVIVAVSNGGADRVLEYLPPYATHQPRWGKWPIPWPNPPHGRADETFAYYRDDVDAYIRQHYRLLPGRENVATCGSSLGGLFSTYIAWEHPDFAHQHAILSPSYWITCNWLGTLEVIERMKKGPHRDVRLWLDSGTQDQPGHGDDGRNDVQKARDVLLANGYRLGPDFQYFLDEGAVHNEAAWAGRLHRVFRFLFPVESNGQPATNPPESHP